MLLARTLRAPSYKAIAMALLRNSLNEIGLVQDDQTMATDLTRKQLRLL